jgi:hypothetical protein
MTLKDKSYCTLFHNSFNNPNAYPDFEIKFYKSKNTILVHRYILAGRSSFFSAMFSNGMKESQENKMVIKDNEELMTLLIKSLYTGRFTVPSTNKAHPLLLLADKYQLPAHEKLLISFLERNINAYTALQCIDLDERKVYKGLVTKAKQCLRKNAAEILQGSAFLKMDADRFHFIEQHCHLGHNCSYNRSN